jgi:hypothetical protein
LAISVISERPSSTRQGIALSAVAKCKLIKWFKPGEVIALTPDHMRAIFLALLTYRNELFREQLELFDLLGIAVFEGVP